MSHIIDKYKEDVINTALENEMPVLLVGETGTGKTTIVANIAKSKKKDLVRLSLNDQVGREDLIGKFGLEKGSTKWIDGPILEAMRNGSWVVLDELNSARPEILFSLHSLLDDERAIIVNERDNEKVIAHKDFRVFATINPISYHGTKNLNQAFLSRFVIINIDVLKPEEEARLLKDKTKADDATVDKLVNLATSLRKIKEDGQIDYFCSTRDLVTAANLIAKGIHFESAIVHSMLNKMIQDDIDFLTEETEVVGDIVKKLTQGSTSIMEAINKFEKAKKEHEDVKTELESLKDLRTKLDKEIKDIESLIVSKRGDLDDIFKEIDVNKKYRDDLAKMTEAEKTVIAKEYLKKIL